MVYKIILACLLLTGCTNEFQQIQPTSTQGQSAKSILLTEIEGCKIYKINIQTEPYLYLSRCVDTSTVTVDIPQSKNRTTHVPTITYYGS